MPTPAQTHQPKRSRGARRFLQDRSGAAAVEFAFVAGPFLLMLFAVIELALVFLLSTSLDAASDQAARRIRTGQMQADAKALRSTATTDAQKTAAEQKIKDDYRDLICAKMTWLAGNCATSLVLDVRTHTRYADVPAHNPVKVVDGKRLFDDSATNMQFAQSLPAETIVVVRSYYKWPLITPFLSQGLSKLDGNVALVSSTQTFRTEPYQ